ncbi:MAG: LysE family translocator [Actinobacteria bacterium]|nr:LysE family translocator [Actinomycetota bacterium]
MGALIGIFFSSMVIGLSGAMMPGPMLSVAVTEAYKKGSWSGPLLVVGHAIPEFFLAVLFTLGLNRVLDNKILVGIIGVVGGLFLGWLAVKISVEARQGIALDLSGKQEIGWGPVVAGIWVSVSNPGWIIWWATIGAGFIVVSLEHGIIGLAFFYTGHILADFLWYSLVSFAVSHGRGRVSDRVYHVALYACALLVAVFAVYFVINGILTLP